MGEEGTNLRLSQLEKDNDERKKLDKLTSDRIVIIEKLNIKQDITLTAIMWTLKIALGVFITFVIENGLMYYASKH